MPIELQSVPREADKTTAAGKKPAGLSKLLPQFSGQQAIGSKERMFFTEQLALLLETGATLQQALSTMAKQNQRPAVHKMLTELEADISAGRTFSQALDRQSAVFSSTYVSLVAASEDGGFLDRVLQQLLEMEEKREKLRTTLTSAFTYPIFLTVFSLAVVAFVIIVVFPKFGPMFTAIYDDLPSTTRGLMWLSDVLRNQWIYVLAAVAGCFLVSRQWLISDNGRARVDRLKVELPGLRAVFIQTYMVQSLRVMSLSLGNGVSLVDTLAACKDVVENREFRRIFDIVQERVQQGAGVAAGFTESSLVPPLVQQMIATGEESGNLPKVMSRLADYYERELGKRLTTLSKMAEPIMLMVMGLVVGIIVSSLILPIFKLSRAVS